MSPSSSTVHTVPHLVLRASSRIDLLACIRGVIICSEHGQDLPETQVTQRDNLSAQCRALRAMQCRHNVVSNIGCTSEETYASQRKCRNASNWPMGTASRPEPVCRRPCGRSTTVQSLTADLPRRIAVRTIINRAPVDSATVLLVSRCIGHVSR